MTISAPPKPLTFGDSDHLDSDLSGMARSLRGSVILRIGAEVRALIAQGRPVCNLTVGDFDPRQFPIPDGLREAIVAAIAAGETNYPPSDGVAALRQAVVGYISREHGVTYPIESVVITSGGRPAIYAIFRCLVDPGDAVVYGVPSWNNDYYAEMVGARKVPVATRAEHAFQPTAEALAPHLPEAGLLCLCSPGNPTGTVLPPAELRAILELAMAENRKRQASGRRPLFVLHDLMYGSLLFGGTANAHALAVMPEAAPWVVAVDGISKAFGATGLRVGWATGAPAIMARIRDFLGHVGAWAPRPEQVATAKFLEEESAIASYRTAMIRGLEERLDALTTGFEGLRREGHAVNCVRPEGAIYLSLQLDLVGKRFEGTAIQDNEAIRRLLLERAGLAVVPFQAFGLPEESGWFRLSVGAVSPGDIAAAWPRLRSMLSGIRRG